MKKTPLLFFVCLALLGACKSSGNKQSSSVTSSPVLQTIGDKPVYSSEFAYVYKKNNANTEDMYSEHSVREYLRLYTNFKLKVRAAEDAGLDTLPSFKSELSGYKKQLAQPYFTEKGLTEKFAKQAYDRLKEEVNASHILIMVKEDADPKDTLDAWNKIVEVRKKALGGDDFAELAKAHSEDPSAKSNAGNLGYFSAMQMVFPFEDAAYNLEVGDVSEPVRTRFGYHIIKLHDRRPSQGEIRVAHIMVRATSGMSEEDSIAASKKIQEIYSKLENGEKWESLVAQFSDDANSKAQNGELPSFSTGRMIPSFENAAFKLTKAGEYSEPVLTPYGWHIIKLLDKQKLPSYEELETRIKQKVSKDRSAYHKAATVERLKKENNFQEKNKVVKEALSHADSSLLQGEWAADAGKLGGKVLFSIGDEKHKVNDFFKYVQDSQKTIKASSPDYIMSSLYDKYVEESNIKYEEAHLEDKYVDYRMLVNEYRDGILLFQLMDDKVWTKAIKDTTGLKEYFNNNREKYQWDERANAVIFNVRDDATLDKLKETLKNDKFLINKDYLTISFNSGATSLSDRHKNSLAKAYKELSKNKELVLTLSGSSGANEKKRMEAVKDYFKSKGVDSTQVVEGKGEKGTEGQVNISMYSKSQKDLEKVFNQDAPLTLQVTKGFFAKGENEILNKVDWKAGTYELKEDDRLFYVVISEIEAPRNKTFEEARGLVISDYQSQLEEDWLSELREKYPVSVNEEEVEKLIKE
ncbi:peptidylprolyl isomerase [Cytophagaceae bacterium ABcell3]|nr:peptidylprolyl isomerase [Cytophagaceae bacterium ABcell3]